MVRGARCSRMELIMKVILRMEQSTDMEITPGLMDLVTRAPGTKMPSKATVITSGLTAAST